MTEKSAKRMGLEIEEASILPSLIELLRVA